MKEDNCFNQDEIKIDLDEMKIYRIERPQLTEEEIANITKKAEELLKNKKVKFGIDSYTGPSPANLESYYSFWRMKILYSIDTSVLNRIIENDFNEDEIFNELGITKDELFKPNPMVVEKVKKYILKSKHTPTR